MNVDANRIERRRGRRWSRAGLALLLLASAAACNAAEEGGADARITDRSEAKPSAAWPMFGHGLSNNRHQPLETVISPESVAKLEVKWNAELAGNVFATPAVADGALYVPDTAGFLYKLDAATGEAIWTRKIADYTGFAGDWSRATPFLTPTSLILGNQNSCPPSGSDPKDPPPLEACARAVVIAVDRNSGDLLWKRQVDDFPGSSVTQSPVVWNGHVLVGVSSGEEGMSAAFPDYPCCKFKGRMLALSANDGTPQKRFQTVPDADGYSGGAVWGSSAVVDEGRGSIYFTTGNNYSVPKSMEACIAQCIAMGCDSAQTQACTRPIPGNHMESIVAIDGMFQEKWSFPALIYDASNYTCYTDDRANCPEPMGPDFDFGQGPMLIDLAGSDRQLIGAGQKSGWFWVVHPDSGELVWKTRVGPGGSLGGMMWGSATDGERIYTASANSIRNYWIVQGKGSQSGFAINRGFWSALDAATGEILWQTPEPNVTALLKPVTDRDEAYGPRGPVTVANGVVFAGTTSPGGDDLFALDAKTGNILWSHATGATVVSGPAVVDGVVYWGALADASAPEHGHSSYATSTVLPPGEATLFAFCVRGSDGCAD